MDWANILLEWFRVVVELIKGIVWPALVIIIVFMFRDNLRKLIDRVKEIDTPWVHFKVKESAEKIKEDIQIESTPETKPELSEKQRPVRISNIARGLQFEQQVLNLLKKSPKLFSALNIKTEIGIKVGAGRFQFDALAIGTDADYIVEIKGSNHSRLIDYGKNQLSTYVKLYSEVVPASVTRSVKGILIIPDCDEADFYRPDLAILKYDSERNVFVNEDVVAHWIHANDARSEWDSCAD